MFIVSTKYRFLAGKASFTSAGRLLSKKSIISKHELLLVGSTGNTYAAGQNDETAAGAALALMLLWLVLLIPLIQFRLGIPVQLMPME
jgi:hypothetical protein